MPHLIRRVATVVLMLALLSLVMIGQRHDALAQVKPLPAVAPDVDSPDGPKPAGFLQFTLPEDRDATEQLRAVMDYMEKSNIPWDIVTSTAQRLLDARSDSFFVPKDPKTGKETGGRVSVKVKINDILGSLQKEGRQVYELNYGTAAENLLKKAIQANYDKQLLAEVVQRYYHSKPGAQAAILLANLDLETGNYPEAAYGFQRLLARQDADEFLTPRLLFKAMIAFKRGGDQRQLDQVPVLLTRLEKRFPREGLVVGRRTLTLDDVKLELERPVSLSNTVGDGQVTMRYGNASRTGRGLAGTPFLEPSYTSPVNYRSDDRSAYDWVNQQLEQAFRTLDASKKQVALPGFFPLTTQDKIIYRTYDGVYAIAAKDGVLHDGEYKRAGEVCWALNDLAGSAYYQVNPSLSDAQAVNQAKNNWSNFWLRQMPGLLFENALLGSMSHDGVNVYCVNDLAIPSPPTMMNPNNPFGNQGAVPRVSNDYSVLSAISLKDGKRPWTLGAPELTPMTDAEEEKSTDTSRLTEGALFLGPPLPLNGKLYLLYERKGQVKLMCVDPYTLVAKSNKAVGKVPALVWVQNLGSPNTRLSQDSLRRLQPCFISYSDGVLVCPTNSGALIAVDLNARSLLWARYYMTPQTQQPMEETLPGGGRIIRGGRIPNPNQGQSLASLWDRWRAAAPIIVGNKVISTAYDSDSLQCFNLRTGELLWSTKRDKDDLYVAAVHEGKVIVVGRESVKAYDLNGAEGGKAAIVWQSLRIGTPCGHGAMGLDGLYYLPMVGNPDVKENREPQIWAIDVNTGLVKFKPTLRKRATLGGVGDAALRSDPRTALGNLLFHDGQLISQSATDLSSFPLMELKSQEMTRRLQANPNDPEGLFDRGELSLDQGEIQKAIADFKAAQKNNPSDILQRKIRDKLYTAYTELLRNDFAGSESFLSEYEALCEVPIDTDDPSLKQRLMDEQIRRRGLYLSLLAKGREKQGRLLEAFKAYRAFASLGENKQLIAPYDEPNTLMRPDVWARGRIDAMVRNIKDPQLQKPLAELVQKEWEAVRDSNDLAQLREFVKVFGPYFATGREAQLLLGERLLKTNNDEELREAQTILMQLWATTEDRLVAARAVEALARVMTRRGMMEDAVGLYGQLGSKYADVLVRDGKTGADLFSELVTDKRLLPFLEPSKIPSSSRYKVEMQVGQAGRNPPPNTFALTPEGELLSFFKRYHLGIEANPNDQTVQLRVTDRVTGELRCKFTGLSPIQTTNGINQGPPPYRMAQVSGHLLLVTIGQFAYCFDLAEKRELWRYNLLGESSGSITAQRIEFNTDGELQFFFEDGWILRLGRSTVIQPTYATLLTRDGLVTLDPTTKEKLWVRSNVSSRAIVFGDASYVFVVEGNTSRVFRAVDGVQVQGVPDFANTVVSTGRLGILGRTILLQEGSSSQPKTLRLVDAFTGQDVWKKTAPPKTLIVKTLDPEQTGWLQPDGSLEVFATRTGEVIAKGRLDEAYKSAHFPPDTGIGRSPQSISQPLVLLDAERVYLFLNKEGNQPGRGGRVYFGPTPIRAVAVNGTAYAFERSTGKRLWFMEGLLDNQQLLLERFDELPVLVAAGQSQDENNVYSYRVVTIDKQTGKLKYNKPHSQNGYFQAVSMDAKTRTVEFWRYDLRLRITMEEANAMPAAAPPP